jgi:hypothetical protein
MSCVKDILSIGAYLATIGASLTAMYGIWIAVCTYKNNTALKEIEVIQKLYDHYLEDENYKFYEDVKKGKLFELDEKTEKLLNQALTLFDEIHYLYVNNLLPDESLEYFASEILNFADNPTVKNYVENISNENTRKGRNPDIAPFSGFTALRDAVKNKWPPIPYDG